MEMRVNFISEKESFQNDLLDIIKLFYVVERFTVNEISQNDTEDLVHTFIQQGNEIFTSFLFMGKKYSQQAKLPEGAEENAILKKRHEKRLCKLTLYALIKSITNSTPPWGSLTGVRPSRLLYDRINEGETLENATDYLINVYDVSKDKAILLKNVVKTQLGLLQTAANFVDVYVSIPFCKTRCAYCSFPGDAIGKGNLIPSYLVALFLEMKETANLIKKTGHTLRAVYVGGGTPTALNNEDFEKLLQNIFLYFPNALEYTVEAGRPDTLTHEKLSAMRAFDIQRISINPQTMNNRTLRAIGRGHTAEEIKIWFEIARKMGFDNINMDVIAGLPGEDEEAFAYTMQEIKALSPDSLTVHTLAMKRTSRLNMQGYLQPSSDVAMHMVKLGQECAYSMDMMPYYLYRQKYMAGQQENVGYAKNGKACLYNVDIMEENTTILAVGAGSISKRVLFEKEARILRAPNVSNVAIYIERVEEMAERKVSLFYNS